MTPTERASHAEMVFNSLTASVKYFNESFIRLTETMKKLKPKNVELPKSKFIHNPINNFKR